MIYDFLTLYLTMADNDNKKRFQDGSIRSHKKEYLHVYIKVHSISTGIVEETFEAGPSNLSKKNCTFYTSKENVTKESSCHSKKKDKDTPMTTDSEGIQWSTHFSQIIGAKISLLARTGEKRTLWLR